MKPERRQWMLAALAIATHLLGNVMALIFVFFGTPFPWDLLFVLLQLAALFLGVAAWRSHVARVAVAGSLLMLLTLVLSLVLLTIRNNRYPEEWFPVKPQPPEEPVFIE